VSAFGLLTVDVKNDYVQTHVTLHDSLDKTALARVYGDLTARAARALDKEGFPAAEHRFVRTADLRYFGQAYEVRVAVPDEPIDDSLVAGVAETFHAEHRGLYGYDFAGDDTQQVEWVNLRVSGVGPIQRPEVRRHDEAGPRTAIAASARPVCFDPAVGSVPTPVFRRADLRPGQRVAGPAVVEEFGSTVPLHPGFTATVDPYLNLVVTRTTHAGSDASVAPPGSAEQIRHSRRAREAR
jgi:N-methylhydantoinase A